MFELKQVILNQYFTVTDNHSLNDAYQSDWMHFIHVTNLIYYKIQQEKVNPSENDSPVNNLLHCNSALHYI